MLSQKNLPFTGFEPQPKPLDQDRKGNLLSNLEDPQQPDTTQHRDTQLWDGLCVGQAQLDDGTHHDEAIEAVEQGDEVTLKKVKEA